MCFCYPPAVLALVGVALLLLVEQSGSPPAWSWEWEYNIYFYPFLYLLKHTFSGKFLSDGIQSSIPNTVVTISNLLSQLLESITWLGYSDTCPIPSDKATYF